MTNPRRETRLPVAADRIKHQKEMLAAGVLLYDLE
jgi:hypothetical protein